MQLQEKEVVTEEDLLQAAIQYECAKHAGDKDASKARSVLSVRGRKALVYKIESSSIINGLPPILDIVI